ncbi:Tim44/TimA family putative adaptor protein [Mesorhizobium sp. L-8-3]|uniref:Tim44/TimA family putative adaptor protein n=1 Tax=Mesorhizobium sp. L-8-3 TaxID=2744522 RepID=UPI00237B2C58|nr:Tim44/TimA family putative adaptor protein [Mesorhizobium sp. L-8-3]
MLTVYWILLIVWDHVFPPPASRRTGGSLADHAGRNNLPVSAPTRATSLLRQSDPTFDETAFLGRACLCYEVVLEAYAKGDAETLEPLVGQEVRDVFARAVAARRANGVTLEIALVALREAEIVHAGVGKKAIKVGVRFRSELIRFTRATDGKIISGDPRQIVPTADLWTFARDPGTGASAWRLIATEPG